MHYYLIVLLGCLVPGVLGQYYFVTAPNVIRFEHDATVIVSVFGLTNVNVRVWLQLGNYKFSTKQVYVPNEGNPIKSHVRLTENDLTNYLTTEKEKPSLIKICSLWNSRTDCQDVRISYDSGYIIVQTDKPIYTPRDRRVNVRALVFDEYLKAVKEQVVGMDITSPSNMTVSRKLTTDSASGFYTNEIQLPPQPEVGLWTARAFLMGQYVTNGRALFRVEEYVLPTFGVKIGVDVPYILNNTEIVTITVTAMYVYGKPVNGKARLELKLREEGKDTLHVLTTKTKRNQNSRASFKIPVADILASQIIGNQFPYGKTLEIIATVYEDETGNEENAIHGGTMFTTNPYQFKFTQSKLNFRPGMEYFLKFEMLYANGVPAPNKLVEILMYADNVLTTNKSERTDSDGKILESFPTLLKTKEIKFMVSTKDKIWKSDNFVVKQYVGRNQMQVEMVTLDGSSMMRVFTNAQDGHYTGMLFMVVSRGNIVYSKFEATSNKVSNEMKDTLQKMISPSGRLIVFYVDTSTNEIIADSVKFNVRRACRGKELSIKPERLEIDPRDTSSLTVNGDPLMHVGLNIMDKALLLLNNKNVLRRNMMFDMLESHDLGCGVGSGSDSAGVFKDVGLTVLTNANKANFGKTSMDCDAKLRKKRQALHNVCSVVHPTCCRNGIAFAKHISNVTTEEKKEIDPLTACFGYAKTAVNSSVRTLCIQAMYTSCLQEFLESKQDDTDVSARTLDLKTEYLIELERITSESGAPRTRTDFRESWYFNVKQLNSTGQWEGKLAYPDSITEWMIQGIGISNEGVCIAEPKNVTAFQDFFVQLELPYKAKRLEHLEVKATIFNYALDPIKVNVYLEGHDKLCYDRGSGNPSKRTQVDLQPNSAHTVRYPMVPMKEGKLPITVSAIAYKNNIPMADAVKKYLFVENEGVEEQITIQVCLDPLEQAKDCQQHGRVVSKIVKYGAKQVVRVDLTLPQDSIPTTGSGTAYLQGNVMDNVVRTLVVNGVESLFRQPSGCPEQNMVKLAPTVIAMKYLKQTKQVTASIEQKGNQYIRDGISYQVSKHKQPDGSYNSYRSIWLTAYVSKIFCQAKTIVHDALNTYNDIRPSIRLLHNSMQADGSFKDENPFRRGILSKDQALTAFVLVALQECNMYVPVEYSVTRKAMQYLENLDKGMLSKDPHLLALATYALALSKSNRIFEFQTLLYETKQSTNRGSHWGSAGASAYSVETTSYALLALLQLNDINTSGQIVRWLTSHRNSAGAWRSSHDTVIGLQALSEYGIRTYTVDIDLKMSLFGDGMNGQELSITNEVLDYQKIIKRLPVEKVSNILKVEITGQGTGRMMIDLRYNRPAKKNELCGFNVSDIAIDNVPEFQVDRRISDLRNCDVCNLCVEKEGPPEYFDDVSFDGNVMIVPSTDNNTKNAVEHERNATAMLKCVKFSVGANHDTTGMTLVTFGLETGVEVIKEDLDKLKNESENIDAYEYDGKGVVVFYLDGAAKNETNFIFRLKDTFDDPERQRSRQPAALTVYDYYNPDQTCTKMYRTIGETFSYQCDNSEKPQCQCIQNMCVKPSMGDTIAKMKSRDKPALKLQKYTCHPDKADYAVKVNITKVWYDENTNLKKATATILKSIHKGSRSLKKNQEMTFYYPLSCKEPTVVEGDKFHVIGKDGSTFRNGAGKDEYQYPMIGTTLVIRKPKDSRKVRFVSIMAVYERNMETGCRT